MNNHIMEKNQLEIEQLHAEIANMIADTVRLKSVPEKIAAEVDAMREENKLRWIKHEADTLRYAEERQRYAEERKAAEAKQAEERQRYDEERKIRMAKQEVEIKKMNREFYWYPFSMIGGGAILAIVITKVLPIFLGH